MTQIFIASSEEARPKADSIAKALESTRGLEAIRWWESTSYGDYTLDAIQHLVRDCDGAVIVFSSDDAVWAREAYHETARYNAALEFGLFVGMLGRRRTVVVTDHGATLPTNMSGLTFAINSGECANNVVQHFQKELMRGRNTTDGQGTINFLMDLSSEIQHPSLRTPDERAAGFCRHTRGAKLCEEVEANPDHYGQHNREAVGEAMARVAKSLTGVNTIVSFGPGVGSLDAKVVASLPGGVARTYVPIDMNRYLLAQSAARIARNPEVTAGYGVLEDFETNAVSVTRSVRQNTKGPRLWIMLGATLSNLDDDPSVFLVNMRGEMGPDDHFLVDTYIAEENYMATEDELFFVGEREESARRFLAQGVTHRLPGGLDEAVNRIGDIIDVEEIDDPTGAVKGLRFRVGRSVIMNIRRYRSDACEQMFENAGFSIEDSRYVFGDESFGRGIFVVLPKI